MHRSLDSLLAGLMATLPKWYRIYQIITGLPMLYIVCTIYLGFFEFKLLGFYGLFPNQQTNAANLLFSASWTIRLVPPMVYNFILMLKLPFKTAFEQVVMPIRAIPILGEKFQLYYPSLIFLCSLLCYFDAFSKIMNFFGIEGYTFQLDDPTRKKIGLQLIAKEISRREQFSMTSSLSKSHDIEGFKKLLQRDNQVEEN